MSLVSFLISKNETKRGFDGTGVTTRFTHKKERGKEKGESKTQRTKETTELGESKHNILVKQNKSRIHCYPHAFV